MLNDVYITVAGEKFTRWKSIKITQSLETLTSSFDLLVSGNPDIESNDDWPLRTQEECIIYIGDDKLITGYIDNVTAEIQKDSHRISIRGRDKTCDLVDCSYISNKNSWGKTTLLALANISAKPFNLRAKLDTGVSDSRSFQFTLNSSESIFDNLSKKAKNYGLLLITNRDGDVLITNSGNTRAVDALTVGGNILEASAVYKYDNRFSDYIVYAQAPSKQNRGAWKTNINIKVTSEDAGVLRYRPKLIKAASPLGRSGAQEYANWEALVRAGKSQEINVKVQGFRQSSGDLWTINNLVDVYAPTLFVNPATEMLITSVEFSYDKSGMFTKMALKRKDAFEAKPISAKKVKAVASLGWDKLKGTAAAVTGNLEELGKRLF